MTIDRIVEIILVSIFNPVTITATAGLLWQIRKERNRARVDHSEAVKNEADAEKRRAETVTALVEMLGNQSKSISETVGELLEDLAEIPQLRSEVKTTQIDLKEANARIRKLESDLAHQIHRADFFISFARTYHTGAKVLYKLILASGLADKAEWVPDDRFPTGPIRPDQAAA